MRAHAVRVRLDQRGSLAAAGGVEGLARHGVGREHVVAVDPHAGEAEALRAPVERDAGLVVGGGRDAPLVVLAEEDDRRVVDAGPDERLVDVALAAGAVAEVGDDRLAVGAVGLRADGAVLLHAHRVAGRVQRLRADDDRVELEALLLRVPAAVARAAEQAEQLERVDALAPGDAVLAVGREREVAVAQGPAAADLGGLLAEQRGPDAELALALQGGRLDVDAADEDEVAVERPVLLVGQVEVVVGVRDALALRGEQLHRLLVAPLGGAGRGLGRCGREHCRVSSGAQLRHRGGRARGGDG